MNSASNSASSVEATMQPAQDTTPTPGHEDEKPDSTPLAVLERKLTGVAAEDFKPSSRLYLAFLTLAIITLMVALDGTSLSVALPVSVTFYESSGFKLIQYRSYHKSSMGQQSKHFGQALRSCSVQLSFSQALLLSRISLAVGQWSIQRSHYS